LRDLDNNLLSLEASGPGCSLDSDSAECLSGLAVGKVAKLLGPELTLTNNKINQKSPGPPDTSLPAIFNANLPVN
jgi:hypothetical protein